MVAVLAVWGTIGFKIINGLNPDTGPSNNPPPITEFSPKPVTETDTFSIALLDRDPFLGTLVNPKKITSVKKQQKAVQTPLPPIVYGGLIKSKKDRSQIFVLTINGTQHLMRKGQTISEVKLIRGDEKLVLINYKGTSHTIKKL